MCSFGGSSNLLFFDFVRHLEAEEVVSKGDVLVWGEFEPLVLRFRSPSRGRRGRFKRRCARLGEFDQIVRSDMTFAGAIQEQLQDAGHNGLAFNEANFAVVKGMYPSHASS